MQDLAPEVPASLQQAFARLWKQAVDEAAAVAAEAGVIGTSEKEQTGYARGLRLTVALSGLMLVLLLLVPFPELDSFRQEPWSLRFTDRNGETLQILPVDESGLRREFLPLEEIPPGLLRIMLVSEDSRFFLHPGVDPAAVIRALVANRSSGRIVSGASVKTILPNFRVSWNRSS